jgi:Na+/melibiose symporter-like transporter
MKRPTLHQAGIAAIVLLVPGGLLLGAALAARAYKKRDVQEPERPLA